VYSGPVRESKPRRRHGGHKLLRNASLALLLGGAMTGAVYALESNTFRVREVAISGASPQVVTAIADMLVPGCAETSIGQYACSQGNLGPNEFTLSSREMEQDLLRMPRVKSATITPQLPGKLRVSVVERQPEAAWVIGPDVFRVAGDGVVIDKGSPAGLKVVVGQVAGDAIKPGDQVGVDVIHGAEQLQTQLPSQFGIAARRIQYSPADGLAVIGDGGLIAMFGQPTDLSLKMAELQRIVQLARDKKSTIAFVDLRYKTPYFRAR